MSLNVHDQLALIAQQLVGIAEQINKPEPPPEFFASPKAAFEAHPEVYIKEDRIKYALSRRHLNGLLESGAVTEHWNNPDQTRPKLTINHGRWVEWSNGNYRRRA